MAKKRRTSRPAEPPVVVVPEAPRSRRQRLGGWLAGILAALLVAGIGGAWSGLFGQLVDLPALWDRAAHGPALRTTVLVTGYESGFTSVFRGRYHPNAGDRKMMATPDEDFYQRLSREGAAKLASATFGIALEGNRAEEIQIVAVRPIISRRQPLATGTIFDFGLQGSGEVPRMGFDLDAPVPIAREIQGGDKLGTPYFTTHKITLANEEQDKIVVDFEARNAEYTFTLAIDYLIGDHQYTTTVDDDGHPFRVTGPSCLSNHHLHYRTGYALTRSLSLAPTSPYDAAGECP